MTVLFETSPRNPIRPILFENRAKGGHESGLFKAKKSNHISSFGRAIGAIDFVSVALVGARTHNI